MEIKDSDLYKQYQRENEWVLNKINQIISIKKKNILVNLYWTDLQHHQYFELNSLNWFNPYKMRQQRANDLKDDLLYILKKERSFLSYGLNCKTLKDLEEWDDTL